MRRAAKVDANQSAIVRALRAVGAKVQSLATVGRGCPDILVAHRRRWFVCEIKNGGNVPSAQQLTDDEKQWHREFSQQADVHVVRSVPEALAVLGIEVRR